MKKHVGVIGLGAMGLGVARSLLRAGFPVHAYDLRGDVLQRFANEGGIAAASPAALGAQCDIVMTLVVNAAQTEAVLFGENGAAPAMKPGSVVLASATVPPAFAVELGKRLQAAGLLSAAESIGVISPVAWFCRPRGPGHAARLPGHWASWRVAN